MVGRGIRKWNAPSVRGKGDKGAQPILNPSGQVSFRIETFLYIGKVRPIETMSYETSFGR